MPTETLGTALPREQARCRQLLSQYQALGPPGIFVATMLEATLQQADAAVMGGDLVAMIRIYQELRDFTE